MLFKRRQKPHFTERLRVAVWPRHSWSRSTRYFTKRILRLSASPHAVAAGVAAGVLASSTPFIGLHFILGFVIAFFIGGNMIAAALGTFFGNPLTFPIIWATTFKIGNQILGGAGSPMDDEELVDQLLTQSFESVLPIFKPMLVGAIPLGATLSVVSYVLVFAAVRTYQRRRRVRLQSRRAEKTEIDPDNVTVTRADILRG